MSLTPGTPSTNSTPASSRASRIMWMISTDGGAEYPDRRGRPPLAGFESADRRRADANFRREDLLRPSEQLTGDFDLSAGDGHGTDARSNSPATWLPICQAARGTRAFACVVKAACQFEVADDSPRGTGAITTPVTLTQSGRSLSRSMISAANSSRVRVGLFVKSAPSLTSRPAPRRSPRRR